jgi:hypothetical protein
MGWYSLNRGYHPYFYCVGCVVGNHEANGKTLEPFPAPRFYGSYPHRYRRVPGIGGGGTVPIRDTRDGTDNGGWYRRAIDGRLNRTVGYLRRYRTMSKKDFIRLGDYIRDCAPYCEPFTERQVEHLANFCHHSNPRFNRERWLAFVKGECGPCGGRVKT